MEADSMKTAKFITKIVVALAAVAGAVYVVATYGEQIVAWCRKVLASLPCCNCKCTCDCEGDCTCDGECTCECKDTIEEVVEAEIPEVEEAVEEAVVEEAVAEEDFAE